MALFVVVIESDNVYIRNELLVICIRIVNVVFSEWLRAEAILLQIMSGRKAKIPWNMVGDEARPLYKMWIFS